MRELRNVVQGLVLSSHGKITAKGMSQPMIFRSPKCREEFDSMKEFGGGQVLPLREMERIFRTNYFRYVRSISSSDSNAAEKLGLAPSNFFRMCKELGLKP
jgi:DNA-binding NtrC family response regulator